MTNQAPAQTMNNDFSEQSLEEGPNFEGSEISRPVSGFTGITTNHLLAMQMIEDAWKKILEAFQMAYDLNIEDENFTDTPKRIAKMMILERCSGINSEKLCIEMLRKTAFPAMDEQVEDQLIVTTSPAITYGICPHHFENVRYQVWTGYVPKKHFTGISKFSRTVEMFSKQPILQESYTSGIARIIMEALDPKGVIVVVKGAHDCMVCRGAKSNPNQFMITSAMRGIFSDPGMQTYKEEFFTLCRATGL